MEIEMEDLYKDACVIKRAKGTVTNGVEDFDTILQSKCSLQVSSSGDTSLGKAFYLNTQIIMPFTTVLIETNDLIIVTTCTGRTITGTIENYNSYSWEGISGTVIWIKKGNE